MHVILYKIFSNKEPIFVYGIYLLIWNLPLKRYLALIMFLSLTLFSITTPFDDFEISCIMYLKILRQMEHSLFWSKCSIFHNIKSIQNLT